jgi:starch-binding outer membrane protein, SusD/RagB family
MRKEYQNPIGRSLRLLPRLGLVGGTALALGACDIDSLLEVEDPTVAAPGTIQVEGAVPTTLAAAIGRFAIAYSGAPGGGSFIDGQISMSAMLSDEAHVPDSFTTRIDVDQRSTEFQNATMLGVYARLHTARRLAEQSADLHAQFTSTTNTVGHAHALNLAGFTYVLFGENYCSGVPFSELSAVGGVEFGPPLTTAQMFERAIARFDAAIAAATAAGTGAAAVEQLNLARVGKARAQLNLNQHAAAAATAAPVPTGFVYRIFHSEASLQQRNGVWAAFNDSRRVSVSEREGGNGLPFRSATDPRVRWAASGVGFDQSTPLFIQFRHPAMSSQSIVATGLEARLIEAESQMRTGGAWLNTLNALRASPPAYFPATAPTGQAAFPDIGTLAPLTDPGNEAGRVDLLFRERAFWMYLTSHRVGDLRRLQRQYNRTPAQAGWPTGAYFKGGNYGNHVSMLVPFDELNNPLFRDQFPQGCDPTAP